MQLAMGLITACLTDSLSLLLIHHLQVARESDGRKQDLVEVAFFQRKHVMYELNEVLFSVLIFFPPLGDVEY